LKNDTFADRLEAQAKARQALLEKAKQKDPTNDPEFAARQQARLEAARLREEREAEQRRAKAAAREQQRAERAAKAAANVTKAQFKLDGVTCSTSAAKAEAALMKVKGVKTAHVCPDSHVASIEFDKSMTSPRRISSAAKKAGFKVEKGS